jgi:antitoxin VapB
MTVVYIRRLTSLTFQATLDSIQSKRGLEGLIMPLTRIFKSGNSQAVRIPAELAYDDTSIDLRITRLGDVITIYPARASLKDAVAKLRSLPTPPVEIREPIDMPERGRE